MGPPGASSAAGAKGALKSQSLILGYHQVKLTTKATTTIQKRGFEGARPLWAIRKVERMGIFFNHSVSIEHQTHRLSKASAPNSSERLSLVKNQTREGLWTGPMNGYKQVGKKGYKWVQIITSEHSWISYSLITNFV
jgi:hypothetical protein